jgi:translation initiation factor IF-2
VESLKVFELAKKMGMETIALMDKLREFKIPVKSHMADLDSELIEEIKVKFDAAQAAAAAKKNKTVRTKKVATPAASSSATVAKSAKAKVQIAKPVVKSSKPLVKPADLSATVAAAPTVIRRKALSPTDIAQEAAIQAEADAAATQALSSPPEASDDELVSEVEFENQQDEQTTSVATIVRPVGATPVAAPATTPPAPRNLKTAQVISRIDLRDTMGSRAPGQDHSRKPPATYGDSAAQAAADAKAQSHAALEANKFDREAIGKLIKQEALAQARKAGALARATTVETFNASDFRKREMLFQPKKKKTMTGRVGQKTQITTPSAEKKKIKIMGGITVAQLSQAMGIKSKAVVTKLIALGSMTGVNHILDFETAQLIGADYGFEVENRDFSDDQLIEQSNNTGLEKSLQHRPPVVTVMGHVDHGKTSLLDAIRQAKVASGEAGGITQHIGAYSIEINGKKITFLDTPGHEAFTAMRARGAKVTDIVILVVAADDGIMPQTREAITHAKSAGVPIIVAVNKMDLPTANPQRVLQGLTEFELVPEEWGGTTIIAKVSAAKKEGIQELLEMILLQAEVLDLKTDYDRPATGTVIEARLDRGRGPVATVLVQQGRLKVGDYVVAGQSLGRIRAMINDKGQKIELGVPGDPIEIQGLDAVPSAGDIFDVVKDDTVAQEIVAKRREKSRLGPASPSLKMSLEDLFAKVQTTNVKELSILIKADVQGSAEALKDSILKIPADQVKIKVLASSVGGISESDVLLASASDAIIIGFNVRPESGVGQVAQREGIEIKTYSIIYEVIEDIKKAMTGLLAPTFVEKALGRAEVRSLFNVPKIGTIAGCSVIDGKITRQAQVRLLRESKIIYEGKLSSLKRFKDDAKEVQNGYECGIGIENYNDLKVGDVIEAFTKEQVAGLLN